MKFEKSMESMHKIQDSITETAESKTSQMILDINNHTDVVTNLTKSTIRTCEKYCTGLDNKVIDKSKEHAEDHIKLLNEEWTMKEKERASDTFKFWEGLKKEITKTQSKPKRTKLQ